MEKAVVSGKETPIIVEVNVERKKKWKGTKNFSNN